VPLQKTSEPPRMCDGDSRDVAPVALPRKLYFPGECLCHAARLSSLSAAAWISPSVARGVEPHGFPRRAAHKATRAACPRGSDGVTGRGKIGARPGFGREGGGEANPHGPRRKEVPVSSKAVRHVPGEFPRSRVAKKLSISGEPPSQEFPPVREPLDDGTGKKRVLESTDRLASTHAPTQSCQRRSAVRPDGWRDPSPNPLSLRGRGGPPCQRRRVLMTR
jgi:hypothetical protein